MLGFSDDGIRHGRSLATFSGSPAPPGVTFFMRVGMAERAGGVLLIGGDAGTAAAVRAAAGEAGLEARVAASLGDGLRAVAERRWRATLLSIDAADEDLALVRRVAREANA